MLENRHAWRFFYVRLFLLKRKGAKYEIIEAPSIVPIQNSMQQVDFSLNGEYVELNQLLKLVGVCDSGGAGKMLVASGDVKVDGKVELRKTCKIRAGQIVRLGDLKINVIAGEA